MGGESLTEIERRRRWEQQQLQKQQQEQEFQAKFDLMFSASEAEWTAHMIESRNEAINKIAREVALIAELFHDASDLVQSQGQQLDIVHDSVAASKASTEKGVQQLEKAREHHENATCVLM
jgi:t-SNARE complex subunit (syntaxin)